MTSLSDPTKVLGLRTVTKNALAWNGVHTVGDLLAKSPLDLLRMVNIGPVTGRHVQDCLAKHGMTLRGNP